ncbi:ribosomal protein S13 [Bradyrhizobium sp. OAE829]
MMLVEALIMGRGYKAARFHRQAKTPGQNTKAAPKGGPLLGFRR